MRTSIVIYRSRNVICIITDPFNGLRGHIPPVIVPSGGLMSLYSPKVIQYADYCYLDIIGEVLSPVTIITARNVVVEWLIVFSMV